MTTEEDDLLLVVETAQQYKVSERTVERWIERGLPAFKATDEQLLHLLGKKRLRGSPPKGVWLIPRSSLPQKERKNLSLRCADPGPLTMSVKTIHLLPTPLFPRGCSFPT